MNDQDDEGYGQGERFELYEVSGVDTTFAEGQGYYLEEEMIDENGWIEPEEYFKEMHG